MFGRVEDARLLHCPNALTGKGWLVFELDGRALLVGAKKITKSAYAEILRQQEFTPVSVVNMRGWSYWLFQDCFYADTEWLGAKEIHELLIGPDPQQHRQTA